MLPPGRTADPSNRHLSLRIIPSDEWGSSRETGASRRERYVTIYSKHDFEV